MDANAADAGVSSRSVERREIEPEASRRDRAAASGDPDQAPARLPHGGSPGALPPGDHGVLLIAARHRELLVVPSSAVLRSPEGFRVFVFEPARGRFSPRLVRLGRTHHGAVAVLSGVAEGEQVSAAGAFLLDAARRLSPELALGGTSLGGTP